MNKSAKGRRNEYKSRNLLYKNGYSIVVRAAASLGVWDIVALGRGRPVMLVQVKSNRKPTRIQDPGIYDPDWSLRYHVWIDYDNEPHVYDAVTGNPIPW